MEDGKDCVKNRISIETQMTWVSVWATCMCTYTQSQNHGMVEAERKVQKSSGLTTLELISQNHVQMALKYLQGLRFHNLPGQPVPVLRYHPLEKNLFPDA